jgi:hypothetical protein
MTTMTRARRDVLCLLAGYGAMSIVWDLLGWFG